MIKNIIFDLAGVLINLDLELDTRVLHEVGLPDFEECLAREEIRVPMLAYLNGLSSEEEFIAAMRPVCRMGVSDAELLWSMDAVLGDVPLTRLEMLANLRKKGYKVYLLSNIYTRGWEISRRQLEREGYTLGKCFDRVFLSYEMQLAKPDPAIFQAVFDATGIDPEETQYYDDSPTNIEAGRKMGLQAVLVPANELEKVLSAL